MNTVTAPGLARPEPFSPEVIAAARSEARAAGTRVVDVLENLAGLPPAEFTRRLGDSTRFRALRMEDLHRLAPAFDVLSFTEAAQRRNEGGRNPLHASR